MHSLYNPVFYLCIFMHFKWEKKMLRHKNLIKVKRQKSLMLCSESESDPISFDLL